MEMTHVVTFTVDKILDKADLAQSFCHKFVQICLQNEKWKILLSNPAPEWEKVDALIKWKASGYQYACKMVYRRIHTTRQRLGGKA